MLSHDVDTIHGYNDVIKLAELEEKMGFRSCFNFVPERYGTVSLDLIDRLRLRGFDIAVHGLKHDGKLFLSRRNFDRQAPRINNYLKKWQTDGFTSPSMQRNLDWMTALKIDYSISTFDTDPFEPEPEGVGTIFPFVVFRENSKRLAVSSERKAKSMEQGAGSNRVFSSSRLTSSEQRAMSSDASLCDLSDMSCEPPNGFIELPYTLPQDSTLFVILRERSIDIWKRKLDWIAERGGMALLNSHPDYMNCRDARGRWEEYSISFYEEFLQYARERYGGRFWHVLPKEMALFWKQNMVNEKDPNNQGSPRL